MGDEPGSPPRRPRLAEHVLPRRHVIDGQERVVLHDQRNDDVVQVGAREWTVLEAADGTREAEGIVVAARRRGAHARVVAVSELMRTLAARGMIVEGEAAEPEDTTEASSSLPTDGAGPGTEPAAVRPAEDARPAAEAIVTGESVGPAPSSVVGTSVDDPGGRPVVGYAEGLRCDGRGTCCRLYGTVVATPTEARRIETMLPHWQVGSVPVERWTTPMRGSEPGPLRALIARDGACGLLRDDGRCEIHRVGGSEAKPLGCRLFPRTFVDDGESVRVSLKPECPCVLAPSEAEVEAEPVAGPWRHARDLPPEVVVERLPDAVELAHGRWAPRQQVRTWVATLARRSVPRDLAATQWALAEGIEAHGLGAPLDDAWDAEPPEPEVIRPWIDALQRRASARAREHVAWRSERDLVRQAVTSVAAVSLLLRDTEALAEALTAPPVHPEQEARYWSTALHGYRWLGHAALTVVLRDEAVRLWVARSLSVVLPEDSPDFRAPLALVEAVLRAHGIGAYVDDVLR